MSQDDNPVLLGPHDNSSSEHHQLLKEAIASLNSTKNDICASLEDAYFKRMQDCLSEAWASYPDPVSQQSPESASLAKDSTTPTNSNDDVPSKNKRGHLRDPGFFPITIDRERTGHGNTEKTVITYFASTSKAKPRVVSIAHSEETLDSKVITKAKIPTSTSRLPIDACFRAEDNEELSFIPGQMDPDARDLHGTKTDDIEEYLQLFNIKKRNREMERGPIYQRRAADDITRLALKHMQEWQKTQGKQLEEKDLVTTISTVFPELDKKCLELKVGLFVHSPETIDIPVFVDSPEQNQESGKISSNDVSSEQENKDNSETAENADENAGETASVNRRGHEIIHRTPAGNDPDYLSVIDTPRNLYCPRCKLYCCNLHLGAGLDKASLQLQYESAMEMERRRGNPVLEYTATPLDPSVIPRLSELSPLQKATCRRVFLIFEGDFEKIATVINAPVSLVEQFCEGTTVPTDADRLLLPAKPVEEKSGYYSMKSYPKSVRERNAKRFLREAFHPCCHDGPCEDKESNCTCVANHVFCCKTCGRGQASSNFYRGCNCKGPCQKQCQCYMNHRECDPDLCQCDACSDPPGQPTTKQACQNDNITMRRSLPTCVGISEIPNAGYGLFSRYAIPKGKFIAEYVGEIISHDECERRGGLYDMVRNTSLFGLTSDTNIDASNMCNEMRFINNSSTPNVRPATLLVNGEARIGFFAMEHIPAQTEITFNYGFNLAFHPEKVAEEESAENDLAEADDNGRATKKRQKSRGN